MADTATQRRVHRIRHEVRRRPVRVVGTERVGETGRRIVFAGEALDGFRSDGFDDHVKFFFTGRDGETVGRDYTPRRYDSRAGELTIDFQLHGAGAASGWAERAAIGDEAVIGGPKSSMVIPLDYDWHLLAGDGSALPAIGRRLEELPASTRAIVVVQGAGGDVAALPVSAAAVEVVAVGPAADLLGALRTVRFPVGAGFVWCGGEAGVMASVRDWLLRDVAHPLAAMRVAAYWKRAEAGYHQTLHSGLPDAV